MEPFRLQNDGAHKPAVKPTPRQRQLTLLSGLDCLPGQKNLFCTDGQLDVTEEPWQLTSEEFEAVGLLERPQTRDWGAVGRDVMANGPTDLDPAHRRAVRLAVEQGKAVPPRVLAEYNTQPSPGPRTGDRRRRGSIMKTLTISGTREWAVENVNIILGCPHKCRYCYARANALRFGRIERAEEWGDTFHRLRADQVRRRRRLVDGQVMFPTTHDITPEHLGPCLETIERILEPGNRLLIVSKPHLECIEAICHRFHGERILFRFSIGAADDSILSYWEPGAPDFGERLTALVLAHTLGFRTSVSAEPLLDAAGVGRLVEQVRPYVTDSIWIGKMNRVRTRCVPGTSAAEIERIEAGQTDDAVREVYRLLKDDPLIRWKESYKQVLGLELSTVAGEDR